MAGISIVKNIFDADTGFEANAAAVFEYQRQNNPVYRQWCDFLPRTIHPSHHLEIPFLPISFFKTHTVYAAVKEPGIVFTSSGTTGTINSRHPVAEVSLYKKSFLTGFEQFYGKPEELCIVGLLPGYLERSGSSLVYMVDELIKRSKHPLSGTYLHDHRALSNVLAKLENEAQKTLLIGVTYALLDFAANFPMELKHTLVMETGGMKGKREELTRAEVHRQLGEAFHLKNIHSEYGMTELLAQAYSKGSGVFECPPWMKVLVRDETDPLSVSDSGRGALNIIDLSNLHSCSFIATDDLGIVYEDGRFEVLGRMDNSDIRGCSLLTT